jgi:hypothetical protein
MAVYGTSIKSKSDVLERRKQGFERGIGFTHWPDETRITSYANRNYKPIQLTPEQLALL